MLIKIDQSYLPLFKVLAKYFPDDVLLPAKNELGVTELGSVCTIEIILSTPELIQAVERIFMSISAVVLGSIALKTAKVGYDTAKINKLAAELKLEEVKLKQLQPTQMDVAVGNETIKINTNDANLTCTTIKIIKASNEGQVNDTIYLP